MILTLKNFGRFDDFTFEPKEVNVHPNGFGKTTIITAYIWALSGKTLNGFEPRNVCAGVDDVTSVTLTLDDGRIVRRVLTPKGTTAYLDDNVITQNELDEVLCVPVRVAFANTNFLTESSLTSEQLRKLLSFVGLMDLDESDALRKEQKKLRAELKTAQQYALTNVAVPIATVEPLTATDKDLIKRFERASHDITRLAQLSDVCPTCGQPMPAGKMAESKRVLEESQAFCEAWRDEYVRITMQRAEYETEQRDIEDAKRLIERATKARQDVMEIESRLQTIEGDLQVLDNRAINAQLPDGVTIETTKTTKTGTVSSTCNIYYNGVPLKSVNRAKRVEVYLSFITGMVARTGSAVLADIPIWVDNAESVLVIESICNPLIKFYVG